jgi:hypothetical protein
MPPFHLAPGAIVSTLEFLDRAVAFGARAPRRAADSGAAGGQNLKRAAAQDLDRRWLAGDQFGELARAVEPVEAALFGDLGGRRRGALVPAAAVRVSDGVDGRARQRGRRSGPVLPSWLFCYVFACPTSSEANRSC